MPSQTHNNLIVGTQTGDDAAVWRLDPTDDTRLLISTADFFTPVVDDPHTWGRIAATNAVSDVYAMGGRPLFGLNLVAWPQDKLSLDLLSEVLAGGAIAAEEGGWAIAGGHTIDGPEPLYGQAITGIAHRSQILTNSGGEPSQALVLTKPLGTGLVATAIKRNPPKAIEPGGPLAASYTAAVTEMTRLNQQAATVALAAGATAATDITGFGLLGHLHRLAEASSVSAVIHSTQVPTLAGAWELLDQGFVPGGSARNLAHVRPHINSSAIDERMLTMLADAQTSGGLLFCCSPAAATEAVANLQAEGHTAAVVGKLIAPNPDSHSAQLIID